MEETVKIILQESHVPKWTKQKHVRALQKRWRDFNILPNEMKNLQGTSIETFKKMTI